MTAASAQPVGSNGSPPRDQLSVTDSAVQFHKIYSHWAAGDEPSALQLVDAFGDDARGHVRSVQLYRNIRAVALLTDANKASARSGRAIHAEWAPACTRSNAAQAILADCLDLHNRALLYLKPKPQRVCIGQLFGIVTTVLGRLDSEAQAPAPTVPDEDDWEPVRLRLETARRYYLDSAQRSAQIKYFLGALLGLVIIAFAPLIDTADVLFPDRTGVQLATCLVAGAIGATVSVMTRITGNDLLLDDLEESSGRVLVTLGAVRPVIGAVFGALLCAIVLSGMVPVALGEKPGDLFLLGALAFVTGFSERFARDVLSRVESTMPPGGVPSGGRGAT